MAPSNLKETLQTNLEYVERQIEQACQRADRERSSVTLVGVTKYVSPETALELHELGVVNLGESRPQELWRKAEILPDNVSWHMIGHLQTNKVDKTLPLVNLIHSVDSIKLITAIEKEAAKQNRTVDVLLEINASGEANKHGFAMDRLDELPGELPTLSHVRIRGLMTMAAFSEDAESCRPTFRLLREWSDRLQEQLPPSHELQHLSMGMSNDFPIAIEEGATLIRVGSVLFEGIES